MLDVRNPMRAIGGFLDLELAERAPHPHPNACPFGFGRSAFLHILLAMRPSEVWLPFYSCSSLREPLDLLGIRTEYYEIDRGFAPIGLPSPASGRLLLFINYFGLLSGVSKVYAEQWQDAFVADNTQAFYERGIPGCWAFNSARKFFGVPDGSFLYVPDASLCPTEPIVRHTVHYDHLLLRVLGESERAFQAYRKAEDSIPCIETGMSPLAHRLLLQIDHVEVQKRRRENFSILTQLLKSRNQLAVSFPESAVPFAYPFLPEKEIDRKRLHALELFVPTLWPECRDSGVARFEYEKQLAAQLLPLPVDQRYGPADMRRLADSVLDLVNQSQ